MSRSWLGFSAITQFLLRAGRFFFGFSARPES
jgi:hypothetical protein